MQHEYKTRGVCASKILFDLDGDTVKNIRFVGGCNGNTQGVARLAPLAGIELPKDMKFAEQLKEVQKLMEQGDDRARQIYDSIGVCFGYTIARYCEFYNIEKLLILGRVTTGKGGDIILARAADVLKAEFPEYASKIEFRIPDEKSRRHGQAVAAASLPVI